MSAADEDLAERANARLGALLKGKYTLDRVLGSGGMATVYAATHRNGKEFAVKVLHADLSMRTDMRTRFLREGTWRTGSTTQARSRCSTTTSRRTGAPSSSWS